MVSAMGTIGGDRSSRSPTSVIVVFLLVSSFLGACGSGSGRGGDCSTGVYLFGRLYDIESFNDDVFALADLGPTVGVVERNVACPSRDGDAGEIAIGTELREISGIDPSIGFAAEVDGRIHFFRSLNPPTDFEIEMLLPLDDVIEIGLNSAHDGDTRWATIDQPDQITAILEAVRTAPVVESPFEDALRTRLRTVIEIVRSDGLRTRTIYTVDRRLLSDRRVGESGWTARELPRSAAAIIDAALNAAPLPAPRDGLELVGASGTAAVLRVTECRLDRPQLVAALEERLEVAGSRSDGITFAIISGPNIEGYSQEEIDDGIALPDVAGPVLIELVSMGLGSSYCSVVDLAAPP